MSQSTTYNEDELLQRIANSDEKAFHQLFQHMIVRLVYFAKQYIDDHQEAEDCAGFAFQQCWERRTSFVSMRALYAFLYTTVHHKCLDYWKHQQVRNRNNEQIAQRTHLSSEAIDARIIQVETMGSIYREIENLPAHHRQFIIMSFIEELTTEEIAKKLGMSTAHVRTARARALVALRKLLATKGLLSAALALWTSWQAK